MMGSGNAKRLRNFHIAAILMGFASLAFPWWTLILLMDGKLVSSFNLFLWGVVKTGFPTATLPFEWWSLTTLSLVAIGAFLGLIGYRLITKDKKFGRILIAFEGLFTIGSCLLYIPSLLHTFATHPRAYPHAWITLPFEKYTFHIDSLHALYIRHFTFEGHAVFLFQFLSIGFFLAIFASALSLTTLYKHYR